MIESEFGAELRRRRAAAGVSLSELAKRIHYSKGYLSKVETGLATPNHTLAALCDDELGSGEALVAMVPKIVRKRGRPRTPLSRPAGLPADTMHFTGRLAQLAEIR